MTRDYVPYALAVLSGLLLFTSFPPFDVSWLAWIALTPLLVAVHGRPARQAFALGYLTGAVAFGGIFSWIRVFGPVPWMLLAGYLALYPAVFTVLATRLHPNRPVLWVSLVALAWTALEYLRAVGVFGFPWALLGLSQHAVLPVIQVARAAGVYGVSFLVALGAAAAAAAITNRRVVPLVLPLLGITAVVVWGSAAVRLAGSAGGLIAAALQPNVPQAEKFDPAHAAGQLRALGGFVARAGAAGADLIVFPETALPGNIFGPSGALPAVGSWAREARATVIATSLENGDVNTAVAVAPSGMAVSRYDKVRLVAFGEAGIRRGTRHDPLWTPLGRVGIAICFESIFPDVARTLVRNGAELLAIVTNDAWFDGTPGPAQHAAHAVLRAVETGRWVVRAANTGMSMVIDPAGRVRARAAPRTAGLVGAPVSLQRTATPYARWGDLPVWVGMLALFGAGAPQLLAAARAQRRHPGAGHAAAAVTLPWVTVLALLRSGAPWWLWSSALLVFVALFGLARLQPFRRIHPLPVLGSTGAGLAVTAGLWILMMLAYRAAGVPVGLASPAGGWWRAGLQQLLIAAAIEGWLRGTVFPALAVWQGSTAAVALTTAAGVTLQMGLMPEAFVYALVTGVAFGAIRARAGSAIGLILPHALGNLLFSAVAAVR